MDIHCYGSIQYILYTGQTHLYPKRQYFIEVLNLKSKKMLFFIHLMYAIEYNRTELLIDIWYPCLQMLS